jgi:DNA-binding NarL/FixJ family response regulator
MRWDIGIVRAAYRLSPDPLEWLRGVLDQCRASLFDGLGGFATIYSRDAPTPEEMVSPYVILGADTRLTDALRTAFERTDEETRRRAFTIGRPIATLTDLHDVAPRKNPMYAELARAVGFGDVVTVNAHNPDGTGCFLSAPLRRSARTPRTARWARLASHVAAGLRLQRALVGADPTRAAEAIFSPDGRLLGARAAAVGHRVTLGRVVRAIEQARARRRKKTAIDPMAVWTALVDGRWSLVDCDEHGLGRLVLAVPNPPRARDPRRLTVEERVVAAYVARGDSNKAIAYTLGIPEGTVATRARAICAKFGVQTRTAFADRYVAVLTAEYERVTIGGGPAVVGERDAPARRHEALTQAEQEVAALAARGMSTAAIAAARGTSHKTVSNQLMRIFRALGISSRAELPARLRR